MRLTRRGKALGLVLWAVMLVLFYLYFPISPYYS